MEKIFALKGKGNVGKTTTIKKLYYDYLQKYRLEELWEDYEICFIVELNGRRVGITSVGDSHDHVAGALDDLKDCACVVCACRTRGRTHDAMEERAESVEYIEKSISAYSSAQAKANEKDAKILFRKLCEFVGLEKD